MVHLFAFQQYQINIFILLLISCKLFAQFQFFQPEVLKPNNQPYQYAWAGGQNNPQFSNVDIDQDALKDLVVFDRTGNIFNVFKNNGTPFQSDYQLMPSWANLFPKVKRFCLLRDYNCDGLEDIFAYFKDEGTGESGIAVYKASRTGSGLIQFSLAKQLLKYTEKNQNFPFNLYVSNIDLPDVNDIDNDGDLDILTFHIGGGYVEWFRNTSVENGWSCDSLQFEYADNCWGRFFESGISVSLDLSPQLDSCNNWTQWTALRKNQKDARHSGSTVTTLDLNNDGLKEIFLGDVSFANINLGINAGTLDSGFISSQINNFPSNTTPININSFPSVYFLDVNNDGAKDLIASPNIDDISVNDRVAWFYLNTNNDQNPNYLFEQNDFLVNEMIELGSTAAPVFVDMNGDGLKDIIVGHLGLYSGTGNYRTKLYYYENIGSLSVPRFKLKNQDFATLQQYNLKRLVPSFGDLDADGDFDLLCGLEDGTLLYVINNGNANIASFNTPQSNFSGIDVGKFAVPQLYDLDKDGDLDLIIGERNGNLNYFPNAGSTNLFNFSSAAQSQSLGFIDSRVLSESLEGNAYPHFIDYQGQTLLLLGNESGEVWVYDSIDHNILGAYRKINIGLDAIDVGTQSILSTAEIDSNQTLEIVIGNKRGGLQMFSGQIQLNTSVVQMESNTEFEVYPNPTRQHLVVSPSAPITDYSIRITDVQGKNITELTDLTGNQILDISQIQPGFYVVSIWKGAINISNHKLIKL
jgi:hypothetical protein